MMISLVSYLRFLAFASLKGASSQDSLRRLQAARPSTLAPAPQEQFGAQSPQPRGLQGGFGNLANLANVLNNAGGGPQRGVDNLAKLLSSNGIPGGADHITKTIQTLLGPANQPQAQQQQLPVGGNAVQATGPPPPPPSPLVGAPVAAPVQTPQSLQPQQQFGAQQQQLGGQPQPGVLGGLANILPPGAQKLLKDVGGAQAANIANVLNNGGAQGLGNLAESTLKNSGGVPGGLGNLAKLLSSNRIQGGTAHIANVAGGVLNSLQNLRNGVNNGGSQAAAN